jgi:hypothetical protein
MSILARLPETAFELPVKSNESLDIRGFLALEFQTYTYSGLGFCTPDLGKLIAALGHTSSISHCL